MKKTVLWAFMVLIALTTAIKAEEFDKRHGRLVVGITQFPSSFHPTINSMMAKTYIMSMTRRPVTVYDREWKLVCLLCTELPTIENGLAKIIKTPDGKDGIAVTYTLRPDVFWGDGTPVTSKDVIFTWKVGRHPLSGVGGAEFYRSLYKVVAEDDWTFTLFFDRVTFAYNSISDFSLLPAHLEEEKFKDPVKYKDRTSFDTDTINKGLYNGPYVVEQVVHGSHVTLIPNKFWGGEPPKFGRIVIRSIENTAALEANLLSGAIDLIAGELGLSLDQAIAFEKRHNGKFKFFYKPGLIYEHIDLNLDNPILRDKRVRKALIYALDREAISKQLFDGKQPVAHSNVNPLDWVADPDITQYPYDPDKAKALLDEAGWVVGQGGVRRQGKQRLTIELMTTAGNRTRELVQQVLHSQWKQVGIDVRIRNQPARVYFGETVTKRKFKALAMYAWFSSPESVPRSTLHSDNIPSEENNWRGQNYTGFRSNEMDELIDSIEEELDKEKRRKLWRRLQEIYTEELPVIPLYFRAESYILPKDLKGLVPTGHQYPSSLWVEHWHY